MHAIPISRRQFLQTSAGLSLALTLPNLRGLQANATATPHSKPIPSSGEMLPVIGMGTWITFNVGFSEQARLHRSHLMQQFFTQGGSMIDSSPMYGSAEEVLGFGLKRLGAASKPLFAATKVWTRWDEGEQIENSFRLWGLEQIDLYQVHNLLDWERQLPYLLELKQAGRIRYVGISTSHGRRHTDLANIMRQYPLDFVQLTYNVLDREVEQQLLPLAQERGIAVIANRPFQGGSLFDKLGHKPLPVWAADVGCANWAQYFLKFIVSHPAVTCAIPATSQSAHLQENMGAAYGHLPTAQQRQRMLAYLNEL